MPEKRCRKCNELIYDTEKLDELPDVLECQHCHHKNILRRAKPKKKRKPARQPIAPPPGPEKLTEEAPAEVAPEAPPAQPATGEWEAGPGETTGRME